MCPTSSAEHSLCTMSAEGIQPPDVSFVSASSSITLKPMMGCSKSLLATRIGTRTGLSHIPATVFLDRVYSALMYPSYGMSGCRKSQHLFLKQLIHWSHLNLWQVFSLHFAPTIDTCEPMSHSIIVSTPPREAQTRYLFPTSLAVCLLLKSPVQGDFKLNRFTLSIFTAGCSRVFVETGTFMVDELLPSVLHCHTYNSAQIIPMGWTTDTSDIFYCLQP